MRSPCAAGFTTVTFAETATAPEGTPQVLVRTNVRWPPPPMDGPPRGPAALRVSRRRQGVSGWSVVAEEAGGGGDPLPPPTTARQPADAPSSSAVPTYLEIVEGWKTSDVPQPGIPETWQ